MSFKKIGKRVTMLVVTLTIFAITLAVVHAGSSASWTNPADPGPDFSPYTGVASTREWISGWVYVEGHMKRFFWNTQRLNQVITYYENDGYYWTADMKNVEDYALHAYGWYGTNLPSPHYDTDDDPEPFGNGFNDEAEVTVLDPYALSTTTEYYFWNQWRDTSQGNASGHMMYTSQMSEYEWVTGEYNTVPGLWTELVDKPGLYWSTEGLASLSVPLNIAHAQGSTEQQPATPGPKHPRTREELEAYKQEALARQRELAASEARQVEVPVTITFVEPQPLTIAADLISGYQAKAMRFDAHAVNGTERITIGGMIEEDGTIDQTMLQRALENANADILAGIISLRGTVPAGMLSSVQQDERVFLVDVPLPAAFRSARNNGSKIKSPPSVYWVVENMG